jgi:hypothetical protein
VRRIALLDYTPCVVFGRAIIGAADNNVLDGFREIWDLGYRTEFLILNACVLGFPDDYSSEVCKPERAANGCLNGATRQAKS